MQKYLLGVDLGNTKTEYLLCTADGDFVDIHNTGSPAYDGFEDLVGKMKEQLDVLLSRNGIDAKDIEAAGFGLAIPYSPAQKTEIEGFIGSILGIENLHVSTDTGHATYAYWMGKGVGIYSFASTGDITMGMTMDNKWATVGGLRLSTGDEASGTFIHRRAVVLLYDHYYRCGKGSIVFPELISLLGLDADDLHRSLKVAIGNSLAKSAVGITKLMDDGAAAGDELAMSLFDGAGENAGRSAAGCIRSIGYDKWGTAERPVDIVLVGSIWNKIAYDGMRSAFFRTVQGLTGKECRIIMPEAPPVVGGVLRAKEASGSGRVAEQFRAKVLDDTALRSTEMEIAACRAGGCPDADLLRLLIVAKKNRPKAAAGLGVDAQICGVLAKFPNSKA